jgi:hypothetical protein
MIDLPPSLTEHEQVESLAYRLYEDEGKPDGQADEHWARAEQFIHAERRAIASSSGKIRYYPSGGLGLMLVILLILSFLEELTNSAVSLLRSCRSSKKKFPMFRI